MKLSDLLMDDWIAVPLEARDLSEAIGALVELLVHSGSVDPEGGRKLVRELGANRADVVRVNDEIVLVVVRCESLDEASVLLGIGKSPFVVAAEATRGSATARALILLLTPRRLDLFRDRFVPALTRALKDEAKTARLLSAGSPMEIRAFKGLMSLELHDRFLVEDALTPLKYRIYPDTPLSEVVDLM